MQNLNMSVEGKSRDRSNTLGRGNTRFSLLKSSLENTIQELNSKEALLRKSLMFGQDLQRKNKEKKKIILDLQNEVEEKDIKMDQYKEELQVVKLRDVISRFNDNKEDKNLMKSL